MDPQTLASLVRARDLCSILADQIHPLNVVDRYLFNLPDHYIDELSEICKVLGEPCILSTEFVGLKEVGEWQPPDHHVSIFWTRVDGCKGHSTKRGDIFYRDYSTGPGPVNEVRNYLLEWYKEFDQRIGSRETEYVPSKSSWQIAIEKGEDCNHWVGRYHLFYELRKDPMNKEAETYYNDEGILSLQIATPIVKEFIASVESLLAYPCEIEPSIQVKLRTSAELAKRFKPGFNDTWPEMVAILKTLKSTADSKPKAGQQITGEQESVDQKETPLINGLSPDMRTLTWNEKSYPLNETVSRLVSELLTSRSNGHNYLHEQHLQTQCEFESGIRHLVKLAGLEEVIVRESGPDGKIVKGKWGLAPLK